MNNNTKGLVADKALRYYLRGNICKGCKTTGGEFEVYESSRKGNINQSHDLGLTLIISSCEDYHSRFIANQAFSNSHLAYLWAISTSLLQYHLSTNNLYSESVPRGARAELPNLGERWFPQSLF